MAEEITHGRVQTNGIWMHVAEKGEGPLVLLIHGFPELWSCWKHQIHHLARKGYHVVAPDLRGYGDTDCPLDIASYTVFHVVGDLIGLLDQLGEDKAFVVGHDWGAEIAWNLCLFRPDKVRALVNLSTHSDQELNLGYHNSWKSSVKNFTSISFRAESSFAKYDCSIVLKKFLHLPDLLVPPTGVELIDFLETPDSLPPWITEEELEYRAKQFKKSGFAGALNYYRNINLSMELFGPWRGAKITVPTKFITSNKDVGYLSAGTNHYIQSDEYKKLVPGVEVVVLDGGHFIQEEKAEQVVFP